MWRRLLQILGLMASVLGWAMVACTLAMDHWREARLGGQGGSSVVEVSWYWSNLWKDCYEDSTSVVNCVDLGVLWMVKPYIQGVRGLLMVGLALGFVGTILAFFGVECTFIGGDQRTKDKLLLTASAFQCVGCVSGLSGYCLYICKAAAVVLHPKADPTKLRYDIGAPVYVGLVGSVLLLLASVVYSATAYRVVHPKRMECSSTPAVPFLRDGTLPRLAKRPYGHSSQSAKPLGSCITIPTYQMTSGDIVVCV